MLIGGLVLYLNMTPDIATRAKPVKWPGSKPPPVGPDHAIAYGWPRTVYVVIWYGPAESDTRVDSVDSNGIATNIAVTILLLMAIATTCECLIRRRPKP
jgi:hypothetical protein